MRKIITIVSLVAVIFALSFTSCTDGEANFKALVAQEWSMEKIVFTDGQNEIIAPKGVYILFTDSLRVAGRGGCNQFMGGYKKIDNKTIEMGKLGSTMMLCPEMDFENRFFQLIEKVTTFKANAKGMELSDKEGTFKFIYVPRVIEAAPLIPAGAPVEGVVDEVIDGAVEAVEAVGAEVKEVIK